MLVLAKDAARSWLQTDAEGFWKAVRIAMEPLWELVAPGIASRAARATPWDPQIISALLRVSAYAGNAGFDLLVPRQEEGAVLQVEVKLCSDPGGRRLLPFGERAPPGAGPSARMATLACVQRRKQPGRFVDM